MFDYAAYSRRIREELHRIPEIGFDLPKTIAIVKRELDAMGITYTEKFGKGSIVATINEGKPFTIGDIEVTPVPVIHATVETYGYVFRSGGKSFGYVPDIQELPESSKPLLMGLDALAMDGLRFRPHRTHFNVEQNVAHMQELCPKLGLVTHCGHEVDYEELCSFLPPFMQPAYDGMKLYL